MTEITSGVKVGGPSDYTAVFTSPRQKWGRCASFHQMPYCMYCGTVVASDEYKDIHFEQYHGSDNGTIRNLIGELKARVLEAEDIISEDIPLSQLSRWQRFMLRRILRRK